MFFSRMYRVIRYDLRGYGRSSTPRTKFSNVADLKAVMDALHVPKAILLGSSYGGGVALDFALEYPERVCGLILSAPFISGNSMPIQMIWNGLKNYLSVRFKGRETAIESFIKSDFWQYFIPPISKKMARDQILNQLRNADVFCRFEPRLSLPLKPSAVTRLHKIMLPTCMIIGDQDHPYNIKSTDLLHTTLCNSSKVVMGGCGHLPFVEEADTFNGVVMNFLGS